MTNELKTISFYLAKGEYDDLTDDTIDKVIKLTDEKGTKVGYSTDQVFEINGKECRFMYLDETPKRSAPDWVGFINTQLADDKKIKISGYGFIPKGVLLINNDRKIFITTFGYGGCLVKKDKCCHDFGIKVAMNMCGNQSVKQTSTIKPRYNAQHISRQTSMYSDIRDFEIKDTDFLNYISAQLDDDINLQGRGYININLKGEKRFSWDDILKYTEKFQKAYKKRDYEKTFPFYANFENVDIEKKSYLDTLLLGRMKYALKHEKSFSEYKISLCIPEFIDEDKYCYAYSPTAKTVHMVITADNVFKDIVKKGKEDELTIKKLLNKKIYAADKTEWKIFIDTYWSIYNCLTAEMEVDEDGKKVLYVLSAGIWKRVSDDLYQKLTKFLENISENVVDVEDKYKNINIYNRDSNENREEFFNKECSKNDENIIMFDKAKLRIGEKGAKNYEFCDLLIKEENDDISIVHVKKIEGNVDSVFKQARLYGESFLGDATFLKQIKDFIGKEEKEIKTFFLDEIPNEIHNNYGHKYKVCIWLLYNKDYPKPEIQDLSLPSKYELREAFNHLKNIQKYKDILISFVSVEMAPKILIQQENKLRKEKLKK